MTTVASAKVWLEIVGGPECREGERLSRANQSVKSSFFPDAERRCHAHSAYQPTS